MYYVILLKPEVQYTKHKKDPVFIQGMSATLETLVTPDTDKQFSIPNAEAFGVPRILM